MITVGGTPQLSLSGFNDASAAVSCRIHFPTNLTLLPKPGAVVWEGEGDAGGGGGHHSYRQAGHLSLWQALLHTAGYSSSSSNIAGDLRGDTPALTDGRITAKRETNDSEG